MFPISKALTDKLSLLMHLKQSLSRNRLFNEIKLDRKKLETQQFHLTTVDSAAQSCQNNSRNSSL